VFFLLTVYQIIKKLFSHGLVFLFFTLTPNDRGYGHPAVCGSFTVAKQNSECGSKTAGMHVSQPMNRRVLAAVFLFVS